MRLGLVVATEVFVEGERGESESDPRFLDRRLKLKP